MKISRTLLVVMVVATLFLAGCETAKPAALSNDQVVQVVDNILTAVNAGDFQGFNKDFSEEMSASFSEEQFNELVDLLRNSSGNCVSCADTEPGLLNNQGYAVYRLACTYELESVMVTVTFKIDGDKVEGLFFDSTNLRNIGQ